MKVEKRRIDTIRPYEQNPRQNDAAVDAVAASIQEFGFRQPIVVDPDGVIVVGHRFQGIGVLSVDLGEVRVRVVGVGLGPQGVDTRAEPRQFPGEHRGGVGWPWGSRVRHCLVLSIPRFHTHSWLLWAGKQGDSMEWTAYLSEAA